MLTSPKKHPSVFPPCVFLHFRFLAFSPLLFYLDLEISLGCSEPAAKGRGGGQRKRLYKILLENYLNSPKECEVTWLANLIFLKIKIFIVISKTAFQQCD